MESILYFLALLIIQTSASKSTYQIVLPGGSTFPHAKLEGTIGHALNDYTLCHWSRTNVNNGKFAAIFSYDSPQEDNAILSFILHNTKVQLNRYNQWNTVEINEPATSWLHFCGTWSVVGNSWQMFVNGQKVGSGNFPGAIQAVQPNGVVILGQEQDHMGGGFDENQALSGQISEVHLWDYILTDEEIKTVSECNNEEGNIIGWNTATWSLHQSPSISHINLPC